MEDAAPRADIFVTATGNKDVITIEHMRAMKDRAIVANIGHFDNEIQVDKLYAAKGVKKTNIKPQVDMFTFADGHSVFLLAEGRFILLDEDGNLALATPSAEGLKVHAKVALMTNNSWTVPALAGTTLYVRDRRTILALDLKAPSEQPEPG